MRINAGITKSVISTDLWLSYIKANQAYMGWENLPASIGNFSHIQLMNPLGSLVNLLVYTFFTSLGSVGDIQLRRYDIALANMSNSPVNLLDGSQAGAGQIRNVQNAAPLGTQQGVLNTSAGRGSPFTANWLCELTPGKGILVVRDSANVGIEATVCWAEIPL